MTKILQSIPYPTYTTAERDLLVDVLKNTYINNSDTGKVEEYDGVNWISNSTDLTNYLKKTNESLPTFSGNTLISNNSPLYNGYIINDVRGVCPSGFSIPTVAQFQTLVGFIGQTNAYKLKTTGTTDWIAPNDGATNEYGFSAMGNGMRDRYGNYINKSNILLYRYSDTLPINFFRIDNTNMLQSVGQTYGELFGTSIRCIKNNNVPSTELIVDASGNIYTEVQIGNQIWLKEDLKTTKFNNGDTIPNLSLSEDWINTTSGALCYYNNNTPPPTITYKYVVITNLGQLMVI